MVNGLDLERLSPWSRVRRVNPGPRARLQRLLSILQSFSRVSFQLLSTRLVALLGRASLLIDVMVMAPRVGRQPRPNKD